MVKFEGFSRGKNLGRFSEEAIGASTSFDGEVTKAEYVKDKNGKAKASANGNKQIKINVKVTNTKGDKSFSNYVNVTYFETNYSPKLSEIAPKKVGDKEILKKVNVVFSNGGKVATEKEKGGFGTLDVYNMVNKDTCKKSSGISIFGGNIKVGKKMEIGESYFIEGFNGEKEVLVFGKGINITLKGVIEPIKDTEKFMADNYDSNNKTLKFNMYCFESEKGSKFIPILVDNVDEDYCKKIIARIKNTENNLVALFGEYTSVGKKSENSSSKAKSKGFGEYEGSTGDYEYEAFIKVSTDAETGEHKIKFFDKKGKLTVVNDSNTNNTTTISKKDDFDF